MSAFDHLTLAIRNFHNSGDTTVIRVPLAVLAVLFDRQTYESLARKGETMTIAAIAAYAYDQIDQARTELEHPG